MKIDFLSTASILALRRRVLQLLPLGIVVIVSMGSRLGLGAELPTFRFDFGPEGSELAAGFTMVSPGKGYDASRGHGFVSSPAESGSIDQNVVVRDARGVKEWRVRDMIGTTALAPFQGFPYHAATYTNTGRDFAAVVEDASDERLRLSYYSFGERPRRIGIRPWRLAAGARYRLETKPVNDSGEQTGESQGRKPTSKTMSLRPQIRLLKDVVYGDEDPDLQRLDAYLIGGADAPVVIEFHGGGWRRGVKGQLDQYGGILRALLEQGVAVISADYRLTPKSIWPAQAQDATRVVQFVRSKAGEWNLDTGRIGLLGGSAGAHLALWVGLAEDQADPQSPDPIRRMSTRVAAIVDLWGPTDLTARLWGDIGDIDFRASRGDAITALFKVSTEQYKDPDDPLTALLEGASPVSLVSGDDPPILIVHNGPSDAASPNDPRISGANMGAHSAAFGLLLAERLRSVGVTPEVYIAPDAGRHAKPKVMEFLERRLGN